LPPCALLYISIAPLTIILAISVLRVFGTRFRPNWSKPFVQYPIPETGHAKDSPLNAYILIALSGVACIGTAAELVADLDRREVIQTALILISWVGLLP
jgi:hypothetical protein